MARAFGESRISTPADTVYRGEFVRLYRETIINKINNKSNKTIDPVAFYKDYEDLIDNYRVYCEGKNKPYPSENGAWKDYSTVVKAMKDSIDNIDPDKATYFKGQYLSRKIRLRDIRAEVAAMDKPISAENLAKAMVYMRALDKALNDRERGSGIRLWFRRRAEKRDLEALTKFVQSHRDQKELYEQAGRIADEDVVTPAMEDLDVMKSVQNVSTKETAKEVAKETTNEVTNATSSETKETAKTVTNAQADEKVNEAVNTTVQQPAKTTVKEEPAKTLSPTEIVQRKMWRANKAKAIALSDNPDVKTKVIANMDAITNGKSETGRLIKNIRYEQLYKDMLQDIAETWDSMEGASDREKENYMAKHAVDLFINAYTGLSIFRMSHKDTFVTAQKFTDMMLKEFSPVAYDPKYETFGESYFMNHTSPEAVSGLAGLDFDADWHEKSRSIILDAKDELKSGRTKLNLASAFDEKTNDKAPKINADDVPTTNKVKEF